MPQQDKKTASPNVDSGTLDQPDDLEVVFAEARRAGQGAPAKSKKFRTVNEGFHEFRNQLVPKYTESEIASATMHKIEACLKQAFDLSFVAPYGSRGHGTNVRNFSAIDSFAVIPKSALFEDSEKSLEKVRDALKQQFPDAYITEGRPVVAIPFGERRSEQHHIVPSFQVGTEGEFDLFAVPAPREQWIHICPAAHSAWLSDLNDTLNTNLKDFIRVVKAWSYFNDDIVWRYYLELCAADYLKNDSQIVYSRDLSRFFSYLANRELAPFEDTAGCNTPVYGTSIADRDTALAFIQTTCEMSEKAVSCEQRGNIPDAFYWWRKIFDWQFTSF